MALKVFFFGLSLLTICCFSLVTASDDASVIDQVEKSLQGFYNLMHNFLDVVQKDFPPLNDIWNLYLKFNETKKFEISHVTELTKHVLGYFIIFIIGLIFLILVPLVGMFFCCGRWCCKSCGYTVKAKKASKARCKRITCGLVVFCFAALILTGGVLAIICSLLFNNNAKLTVPNNVIASIESLMKVLEKFSNASISLKEDVTTQKNQKTLETQFANISKSFVDDLQNPWKNLTDDLQKNLKELDGLMESATNNYTNAQSIKQNITTNCNSEECKNVTNVLKNWDLTKETDSLKNLSKAAKKTQTDLIGVTKLAALESLLQEISNNTFTELIDSAKKISLPKLPFPDEVRDIANIITFDKTYENVIDYINYAILGVASLVGLISVFCFLGLLFGCFGLPASKKDSCLNMETGANYLMASTIFIFVFTAVICVPTILFFAGGGMVDSLVCRYVVPGRNTEDLKNVGEEIDQVVGRLNLGWNWTMNYTLYNFFTKCQKPDEATDLFSLVQWKDNSKPEWFNLDYFKDISIQETIKALDNYNRSRDIFNKFEDVQDVFASNIGEFKSIMEELDNFSENCVTFQRAFEQFNKTQGSEELIKNLTSFYNSVNEVYLAVIKTNETLLSLEDLNSKMVITKKNLTTDFLPILFRDLPNTIGEFTKNSIAKLLNCSILYKPIGKAVDAICVRFVDPLIGISFGLGWALLFFIPTVIFALVLNCAYRAVKNPTLRSNRVEDRNALELQSRNKGHDNHGYTPSQQRSREDLRQNTTVAL